MGAVCGAGLDPAKACGCPQDIVEMNASEGVVDTSNDQDECAMSPCAPLVTFVIVSS